MKTLRIGHERFSVVSTKTLKSKCDLGHALQEVVTAKAGTFEYCSTCKSTRRIAE